jgi:hypothetical protein
MKFVSTLSLLALSLLAACASNPAVPQGMAPGKFVSFSCEGGKVFSARAAEDSKSVRVRGLHGSAELDMKSDGVYEGDGYTLMTQGADAVTLMHSGKTEGKGCKPA